MLQIYPKKSISVSPSGPPPDLEQSSGVVRFPPEVQAAIETVLPSDDPLDSPDLDVVSYINKMFPTEQSLTGLEDSMSELSCQMQNIDADMRRMVRSQTQD